MLFAIMRAGNKQGGNKMMTPYIYKELKKALKNKKTSKKERKKIKEYLKVIK